MSEEITIEQFKKMKSKPKGLQFIEDTLAANKVSFKTEYRFNPDRRFRFDIAFSFLRDNIRQLWGVEYEGLPLQVKKSGHTTVTGYSNNCEKYNLATIQGWRVLRYTALNYKQFSDDLKKILSNNSSV